MSWDNRILHINGETQETLQRALVIAFEQRSPTASHWRVSRPDGLILLWSNSGRVECNEFMTEMSAEAVTPMVWEWLKSEVFDHRLQYDFDDESWFDGSVGDGWEVHINDSTSEKDNFYQICMIRPTRLWYGK